MEEEKKNPMDLNGDGKVSFGEKVQYYAGKAGEKVEEGVKKVANYICETNDDDGVAKTVEKYVLNRPL